jgi:hypothetical protein
MSGISLLMKSTTHRLVADSLCDWKVVQPHYSWLFDGIHDAVWITDLRDGRHREVSHLLSRIREAS